MSENENDTPSKPGPKPFLTEARKKEVCAILAIGGTRETAAQYVGCSTETIRRAALSDPAFAEELRKAEFGVETLLLKCIQNATQEVSLGGAAAWEPERLYPERYGRRDPHTITREQLTELLRQLAAELARDDPADERRQQLLARLEALVRPAPSFPAAPEASHRFDSEKS